MVGLLVSLNNTMYMSKYFEMQSTFAFGSGIIISQIDLYNLVKELCKPFKIQLKEILLLKDEKQKIIDLFTNS